MEPALPSGGIDDQLERSTPVLADDSQKELSKRQLRKRKRNEIKKEKRAHQGEARKRRRLDEAAKANMFDEIRGEAEYEIDGALRRVKPYRFVYQVSAKGRWLNRTLMDVLQKEFKAFNDRYFNRAIESGRIRINDKIVPSSYILRRGDQLLHAIHRHEPPVSSAPVSLVYEGEDLFVFSKPASIPMHPAGRFRHNTMLFIVVRELKLARIHSVHRLDRLTSGLLIYGKSDVAAHRISQQIRSGKVVKHYLALVEGIFPPELITVEQPIGVLTHGRGIMGVTPDGKYCKTMFLRLAHDPVRNLSLVKCRPFTGRSHQIRIHLKHLGFPIHNDPLYASSGDTLKSHFDELNEKRFADQEAEDSGEDDGEKDTVDFTLDQLPPSNVPPQPQPSHSYASIHDIPLDVLAAECLDCRTVWPDPKPQEMEMCLHALSYQGPGWSFQTPNLPLWASGFDLSTELLGLVLGDLDEKQDGFDEDSD